MRDAAGVLSVTARATGYAHVLTDGGPATALALVVPLEHVHAVLLARPAAMLHRLAYATPRRGTDLTT